MHSFCQDSVISTDKFIHSLFIELLFVDSADIRDINYEYLKKDYSTDVLSFPLQILPWNPYEFITADYDFVLCPVAIDGTAHSIPMQCLGSIIINTDEVLLQAKALKHNLYAELSILFIHAFLHLLGFDHERDRGEQRNFEKAIRESLNLPYGLIERNIMGETS
ncbi:rRNA maturation RNase YbeY [Helicobacter aurati]|uniref:rRNA maturation RNase YbeY n=1 Tax=Helicobacter aurati TaxID=137778 RepID=UPI00398A346A